MCHAQPHMFTSGHHAGHCSLLRATAFTRLLAMRHAGGVTALELWLQRADRYNGGLPQLIGRATPSWGPVRDLLVLPADRSSHSVKKRNQ